MRAHLEPVKSPSFSAASFALRSINARLLIALELIDAGRSDEARQIIAGLVSLLPEPMDANMAAARGRK